MILLICAVYFACLLMNESFYFSLPPELCWLSYITSTLPKKHAAIINLTKLKVFKRAICNKSSSILLLKDIKNKECIKKYEVGTQVVHSLLKKGL